MNCSFKCIYVYLKHADWTMPVFQSFSLVLLHKCLISQKSVIPTGNKTDQAADGHQQKSQCVCMIKSNLTPTQTLLLSSG